MIAALWILDCGTGIGMISRILGIHLLLHITHAVAPLHDFCSARAFRTVDTVLELPYQVKFNANSSFQFGDVVVGCHVVTSMLNIVSRGKQSASGCQRGFSPLRKGSNIAGSKKGWHICWGSAGNILSCELGVGSGSRIRWAGFERAALPTVGKLTHLVTLEEWDETGPRSESEHQLSTVSSSSF